MRRRPSVANWLIKSSGVGKWNFCWVLCFCLWPSSLCMGKWDRLRYRKNFLYQTSATQVVMWIQWGPLSSSYSKSPQRMLKWKRMQINWSMSMELKSSTPTLSFVATVLSFPTRCFRICSPWARIHGSKASNKIKCFMPLLHNFSIKMLYFSFSINLSGLIHWWHWSSPLLRSQCLSKESSNEINRSTNSTTFFRTFTNNHNLTRILTWEMVKHFPECKLCQSNPFDRWLRWAFAHDSSLFWHLIDD